jgi:hypothetical protein
MEGSPLGTLYIPSVPIFSLMRSVKDPDPPPDFIHTRRHRSRAPSEVGRTTHTISDLFNVARIPLWNPYKTPRREGSCPKPADIAEMIALRSQRKPANGTSTVFSWYSVLGGTLGEKGVGRSALTLGTGARKYAPAVRNVVRPSM